ncbi:hypothetical protein L2E82_48780 [Cichorium intybus]|uniref:Uncharacterized protein n=1 Tax=Cichorium intybus TaxID=13427 RepID=A0ACB8YZ36_CICIN|nr:hypothetical protein L2E82_48780 [Cichorium intybus]
MANGSHRMAHQGAITKRTIAIEEMAGMDVLYSDKTGSLTLNKLTVDKNLIEARADVQELHFLPFNPTDDLSGQPDEMLRGIIGASLDPRHLPPFTKRNNRHGLPITTTAYPAMGFIFQLLLEPILATSVYTGLENVRLEGGVSGKYVLHGGDYGGCRLYSQSWESR